MNENIILQTLNHKLIFEFYYWVQFLEKYICVMTFWLERVKEGRYEIHSNTCDMKVHSAFISYRINTNGELS